MARTEFHVVPDGDSWRVKRDGSPVGGGFDTKDEAVEDGRRRARAEMPSQLFIHGEDGRIQDEHTYQDDPFPPRG